jgi:hypothetical protein
MKKLMAILLLFSTATFVSCSDTVVVEGEEVLAGNPDDELISGQFTRRVLIEDFTGTWCGNCTRVVMGVENVYQQTNRAVVVAVHNGNDPYHYNGIEPLRAQIYPDSPDFPLPTAMLNRTNTWTFPEPSNTQQVLDLTGNNCGLGIALNPVVANGSIDLDVKVKFATDYTDLRLVVYVLENNLSYYQINYLSTFQEGQNPIQNYDHDHVLRASLTNILGDEIVENTTSGSLIVKNFTVPLPTNISNPENLSFVAFVIGSDNQVINVRSSEVNESQVFEQNP